MYEKEHIPYHNSIGHGCNLLKGSSSIPSESRNFQGWCH
ncbi:unnamed protein product [Haemonchus placei]|uniref:Uncharacterized protein n=1 Tax=Haemonchus placei TaxID=6290 RepID=A0A0N4WWV8_HAEPC|nr:unnamed protein product [Haemonchus placei]